MAISILGGRAKGFSLKVVSSTGLRPTSVILRRKIFDRFQDLSGCIFVDACAGTGAMGLEAFSRNADKVIFVEANKKYFNTLKKNISLFAQKYSTNEKQDFRLILGKVEKWILNFKSDYITWNMDQRNNCIFFFDPPYAMKNLYKKVVVEELLKSDWYHGTVWVESDRHKGLPQNFWEKEECSVTASYEHSDSYLIVLENSH